MADKPAAADLRRESMAGQAAEQARRSKERYLMLGREYWRRGELDEAEEMLRTARMHQREAPEVIQLQGMVMFAKGRFEEAEAFFLELVDLTPESPSAYANLAIAQLVTDQAAKAERTVRAGMVLQDQSLAGAFQLILACIHQVQGEPEASAAALEAAHQALGPATVRYLQTGWAAPLREHPVARDILREAGEDPDGTSSELLPAVPR